MENHPQLLLVAGPNGAGKSTFSKVLSEPGAVIFDVDKVIAVIEAQDPGMPKKRVYEAATQEFFNQANAAISKRQHFTLETNFRDEHVLNVVAEFKRFGYTVNMIYLTLKSFRQSTDRVSERVLDGGHFVDAKNVQENYELGLQYLERYADRFFNLDIVDATQAGMQLRSLLRIQDGRQTYISKNIPENLKEVINSVSLKFNNSPKKRKGPRL